MLQYNIPQFVDTEDKIVGPLTIRQFAFLAIGVVVLGFIWGLTPDVTTFVIVALPIVAMTIALAFVKVNGLAFTTFLGNIVSFLAKPTLYLWSRDPATSSSIIQFTVKKRSYSQKIATPTYNQTRVNEIAWTLDTYGQKSVLYQENDTGNS